MLGGTATCQVSVYATKEGYSDSDVTTANVEIAWGKKGDVNQDGKVTIADAVGVVNILLDSSASAPVIEEPEEDSEAE